MSIVITSVDVVSVVSVKPSLLVRCRSVFRGLRTALLAHRAYEIVQPSEAGRILAETRRFVDRNPARIITGLADAAVDERLAGEHHVVADGQVAGDADLTA